MKNHVRTFVLTGSSSRKLKRVGANLLAGRALTYEMLPLTAHELGNHFDMVQALRHGMLPAVFSEGNPDKFLQSYVKTYLKEEVEQEGFVRNLGAFARFLEAASFSQASILNIANVANDCSIDRNVAVDYFSILEDLLLGIFLPVFTKRAKRRMVSKRKFFFFDAGVYQAIRPRGPLDSTQEINGAALETLVFQELRALNSYLGWGMQLFFWHTTTHEEVDLVLYGSKGIFAIEVKSSSRLRGDDFKGLRLFLEDYPMAKAILIYGGTRAYREGRVYVVPAAHFFKGAKGCLGI